MKGDLTMMKNLWVKKNIWEMVMKVFNKMKENDVDLTMNRAINKMIYEGLIAMEQQDAPHTP
tara:strand:+ start:1015 stop:1200 length:186 start_codon:yes stop_codon:yes gene_type:complete